MPVPDLDLIDDLAEPDVADADLALCESGRSTVTPCPTLMFICN